MPTNTSYTEDDMAHELNKKLKLKKIDLNIEDTGIVLDLFEDIVVEQVKKGKKVKMQNFGTFESRIAKARKRYNPSTKKIEEYPSVKIPKFNPSDDFRADIANS